MRRAQHLTQEAAVASVALGMLGVIIAFIYWLSTGMSPWPLVVLCEVVSFAWGLILLVVTSPSWDR